MSILKNLNKQILTISIVVIIYFRNLIIQYKNDDNKAKNNFKNGIFK